MARIFEQGGDVQPELTKRVAWGLLGVSTSNSTWQTIVTWLNGVLGFLKTAENLIDVPDKSKARSNLDVLSSSEVGNLVTPKADKLNVLEKDNTNSYTPSSSYNPATKKYIDDKLIIGSYAFGDGPATKVVSIGQTLPNTSYRVFLTNTSTTGNNVAYWATVTNKTATSFSIKIAENVANNQDLTFDWLIVR